MSLRTALARLLAPFAASLGLAAAFAAPPQLVVPHSGPFADQSPAGVHSQAQRVRFNAAEMLALHRGDEVEFTLPNAARHAFVVDLIQSHGEGIYSWVGHHRDRGTAFRAIITTGPGGSFASLTTPDGEYRLMPGNGHDWMVDMKAEKPNIPPLDLGNDFRVPPLPSKAARSEW